MTQLVKAVFDVNLLIIAVSNYVKWNEISIVSLRDGTVLLFVIRI